MNPNPGQAAQALAEIDRQQRAVIDRIAVPAWYWWTVAAGMVVVGYVADTRQEVPILVTAIAYGLGTAALTAAMILGVPSRARVRSDLLGPRGAVTILMFVWVVVGVTLGIGFGLQAARFSHPALAATVVGAALTALGGPWLMGRLRRIMLQEQAAGAK